MTNEASAPAPAQPSPAPDTAKKWSSVFEMLERWPDQEAMPTQGRTYAAEEVAAMLSKNLMVLCNTRARLKEARDTIDELRGELTELRDQVERTPAADEHQTRPAEPQARPTPDSILDDMANITNALVSGRMTAADAKAQLYAHQIALSAMRTIDNAVNRKKKEARLRKTNSPPPPNKPTAAVSASSKREGQSQKSGKAKKRRKKSSRSSRSTSGPKTRTAPPAKKRPD